MEPDYSKAKKAAESILATHDIHSPVVPVFDIAQNYGLKISFIKMPESLQNVAGFLDVLGKVIYVNDEDPPNRKAFTVAHELGHYILEHDPKEFKVLLRLPTRPTDAVEKEANCFAANILVPKEMLENVMQKYSLGKEDVEELAKIFGVSSQVITYRFNHL